MQALLILEGALCILTAPSQAEASYSGPASSPDPRCGSRSYGLELGTGQHLPEWQSPPQLRGLALLEDRKPRGSPISLVDLWTTGMNLFVFSARCLHCLMTGWSLGCGPEAKHLKQWNNKICSNFLKDHGFYVGKQFQAIQ